MKKSIFIAALFAAVVITGCKHNPQEPTVEPQADTVAVDDISGATQTDIDEDEPPVQAESYFASKTKGTTPKAEARQASSASPAPTQAAAPKRSNQAETIYVETDGAQGRVWGHVTMKGDRGTGTIHDWDENTLAVSVTRHGNELFAVDQNSRQYVFKLKK